MPKKSTRPAVASSSADNDANQFRGTTIKLMSDIILQASALPSEKIDRDVELLAPYIESSDWRGIPLYFDSLSSMCQLSSNYKNWENRFKVAEYLTSCFINLQEDIRKYICDVFVAKENDEDFPINVELVDTVSMFVVLVEKLTVQLQRFASQSAVPLPRGRAGKNRIIETDDVITRWRMIQRIRMIDCLIELLTFSVDTIIGTKKRALRYVFAPDRVEVLFLERFMDTVTQLFEDPENAIRANQAWISHYLKLGTLLVTEYKWSTQFAESFFTKTLQLGYLETATHYPFIEAFVSIIKDGRSESVKEELRIVLSMIVRRACLMYDDDRADRVPPKAYCMLIQSLAVHAHDIMLRDVHMVYRLLNNPHPNVRMAALQALADLFSSENLSEQNCNTFQTRQKKREAIFYRIVAHTNDEGTNVRAKAVGLIRNLAESKRIPESFESCGFITVVGGRLLDKSVQVRKCAIQFLAAFVNNNRYGHDFCRNTHVVLLDTKARDLRLKGHPKSRIIQETCDFFQRISFELRGHVKNELRALFKGEIGDNDERLSIEDIFQDLTAPENAAALARYYASRNDFPYKPADRAKHAKPTDVLDEAVKYVLSVAADEYALFKVQETMRNEDRVLENEQATRDDEHTIMQLRAQLQQIINKMIVEYELSECTKKAVRCIMMGETAEIKEGIKFLTLCKVYGVANADQSIRSMCSLVWRPARDVIEELVEAAEDMFISKLNGGEKAAERDKSTVENLMSIMTDIEETDRPSVEEVIYLLAAPEKQATSGDKNEKKAPRKRRSIEVNVITKLWNIALDTSIGNNERKMVALRVLYPISRTEKGLLEARARLRSLQKKLAEEPIIAVEALRIISVLGTSSQQEKQDDAYTRPIFRVHHDDSLFRSIEKLFFREVLRSDDNPQRDWFNIIRHTIASVLNVFMDVNVLLPKLASHFLYRTKRISEFYMFYEKLVERTEDEVAKEVATRRRDYWALTWCRVMEKLMAFCGEVAVQLHAFIQVTIPRLHSRYVKKIVAAEKNDASVREEAPRYLSDLEKSVAQRKTIFAISEEASPENASNDLHHLVSLMCDKRLFLPNRIIGRILPVVVYGMRTKTMPIRIKEAATVAYGKFMPLSADISSFGAPSFFSLMVNSPSELIRCNLIAACCDFAFAQPTLFELYAPTLFRMSQDRSALARESTILVLSHLMSNDMIQTRGVLSEPARCICDNDRFVKEAAQSFFRDLNGRSETIIQLLPEFVYRLASPAERMAFKPFKQVSEFLIGLLKDKNKSSTDSMIDRVCMKFANIDMNDTEAPKYLLIVLVKFAANDGGLHRLQDNWRYWSKFLCHPGVAKEYRSMIEHLYNTSKNEEYRSQCTEIITNINKIQDEGLRKEDVTAPATTSKRGRGGRKLAATRDSSPGPSNRPSRRRKPVQDKSESEEEEMEEQGEDDDDVETGDESD